MAFEFKQFLDRLEEILGVVDDTDEKVIIYNNGVDKIFGNHKKLTMEILLGHDNSPLSQTYNALFHMFPKDRDSIPIYLLNNTIIEKKYMHPDCKGVDIGCLICQHSFCIGCFEKHAKKCISYCKDCGILLSAKKPFHECDKKTSNVSVQIASLRSISNPKYNINAFTYEHLYMINRFIKNKTPIGSCIVCMENANSKNQLVILNGCVCKEPTICESCLLLSMKAKIMSMHSNGVFKCPTCNGKLSCQ